MPNPPKLTPTEVSVLTAHDSGALISEAVVTGARGFLLKMEANAQSSGPWRRSRAIGRLFKPIEGTPPWHSGRRCPPTRWGQHNRGITMVVRILIADDHEIVRRGLRALLETRDDLVVCAEAQDGREAVDLAIEHKPDIAVLDVSLPTLNGIEATRQIRRNSPLTEVLVFTMHDSDELISEVLHAGARGYLLKSEADEQILDAVGM